MSETTTLPPYTGGPTEFTTETCCAKCGFPEATTTYKVGSACRGAGHEYETPVDWNGNPVAGDPTQRLCRQCKRCGYAWDEACIDTPEPEQPAAAPVVGSITIHTNEGTPGIGGVGGPGMGGGVAAAVLVEEHRRRNGRMKATVGW